MSVVLVAAALVVAIGSIAALASADARLGLIGLAAALIGATLVADPLPGTAILGVRLTATLLALALLRASTPASSHHRAMPEPGSHLGWPGEGMLGLAGGLAGLAIAAGLASFVPVTGTGQEPLQRLLVGGTPSAGAVAMALGAGIAAMTLPALVIGRGLRRATAAVLVTMAAILLRAALGGEPGPLEEVVLGALLVVVAAGGALVASAGRAVAEAAVRAS